MYYESSILVIICLSKHSHLYPERWTSVALNTSTEGRLNHVPFMQIERVKVITIPDQLIARRISFNIHLHASLVWYILLHNILLFVQEFMVVNRQRY